MYYSVEKCFLGSQTTRIYPRKPVTQLSTNTFSPQINLSLLLTMSQPSLKETFDDEQLLSTAFAIELEDVKKTSAQLKLDKTKPTLSGPFSLNVDYYSKKIFKELDNIDSRLQILETGEQPRDWKLYKIIWKLENFSTIFNNAELSEETENRKNTDPNLTRDFCTTAFLSKPYGYSFFIRAFPYRCGPALGKSMSITISLIAGPFDVILSWPFKGTLQISVFRQDNSGLIWRNSPRRMIKLHPALHAHHPCNLTRVAVSSSIFLMKKCSRHKRT